MYAASVDPYCYPGTTTLKNIPGLRDQSALDAYEAAMTAQRADEPLPHGRFSVSHYQAFHHHLFQDIYPWAGRFRTIRLAKSGSMFCYPENITREMRELFVKLRAKQHFRGLAREAFASEAAAFLATLNVIHPFREGNGRVQLSFSALLANSAGHPLDLATLRPEVFLVAMVQSYRGDEGPLRQEFLSMIDKH
jgi:cell filamentation protein